MTKKIGRNDPCPCGSGKKYKNCHLKDDEEAVLQKYKTEAQMTPFEKTIEQYNPIPILKLLAILQLQPENHGLNENLEYLVRATLLRRRNTENRPLIAWDKIKDLISEYGDMHLLDEPDSTFTDNVVFEEGNYIVYPGIETNGAQLLNQLLECIFMYGDFADDFKKIVRDGTGLLLIMSDVIAKELGHTRYVLGDFNGEIYFPDYPTFKSQHGSLIFTKESLKSMCEQYQYDYDILREFIVTIEDSGLKENDPQKNIVINKPIIEDDENIIVYMPTTIVSAITNFIFDQSKKFDCYNNLKDCLYLLQFNETCLSLSNIGWMATDIILPDDPEKLPIQEVIFQFDTQKFCYLCYIQNASVSVSNRNKQVISYLNTLTADQVFNVLTLNIVAEDGEMGVFSWERASPGNQSLLLRFSELQTIISLDDTDDLTLWKFAKSYSRTNEKVRVFSPSSILDAFVIYLKNNENLLDSDSERPQGGIFMLVPGTSNEFIQSTKIKVDEHAAPLIVDGKLAYAKVVRARDYAPIYKFKIRDQAFRLLIESFKMPIWITNCQKVKSNGPNFTHAVCEAVAFWLFRMSPELAPVINKLKFIQFEIEIVIEEDLLNPGEFIVQGIDAIKVEVKIEIAPPKIRLHVPYDFLYILQKEDNAADKLLMKAALNGLIQYIRKAGKEIDLDNNKIENLVDKVMQPSNAKMLLTTDISRNVRFDPRGLFKMRYIQESELSFLLDNLVSYLPKDIKIPVEIDSKADKIKLCDTIVKVLLEILEGKIAQFPGEELIKWIVRANEKGIQKKEFREILVPARISCFSSLEEEVDKIRSKTKDLTITNHTTRILIEFVASNIPNGKKYVNKDDVDELLALTEQIVSWGFQSEIIRMGLDDPKMGLLPSGRIGTEKSFQNEILTPFSETKISIEVESYIEKFEQNYISSKTKDEEPEAEVVELDDAFLEEFGVSLVHLSKIIGLLVNEGFQEVQPCMKLKETDLIDKLLSSIPTLSRGEIKVALELLSLKSRSNLGNPPEGYSPKDIFPWRYTRPLSYLQRPLIKWRYNNSDSNYFYGYRHLLVYFDNMMFLLHTGKLPDPRTQKMKKWIAKVLAEKGKPFRDSVRDWLKTHKGLEVVHYEVKIEPKGNLIADRNYGDIDVLAIDKQNKVFYSIECKNTVGARNIHEMKIEMDLYLGRDGDTKKAKVLKHVERDKWLKDHRSQLKLFVEDPESYKIVSLIVTSDELPLTYIAKESLEMPIISFPVLRREGLSLLASLAEKK